jgi:hypothetical protein
MIVNIASIKLRSLWKFFPLTYNAMHIVRQTRSQKGFIALRNTGFGLMHYTLSTWENEEDLKAFARSGAHLESMKKSASLAKEIKTYSYPSDTVPSWKEAKKIISEKGRVLNYR